jgi:hypothetical protein
MTVPAMAKASRSSLDFLRGFAAYHDAWGEISTPNSVMSKNSIRVFDSRKATHYRISVDVVSTWHRWWEGGIPTALSHLDAR